MIEYLVHVKWPWKRSIDSDRGPVNAHARTSPSRPGTTILKAWIRPDVQTEGALRTVKNTSFKNDVAYASKERDRSQQINLSRYFYARPRESILRHTVIGHVYTYTCMCMQVVHS